MAGYGPTKMQERSSRIGPSIRMAAMNLIFIPLLALIFASSSKDGGKPPLKSPEARALDYLAGEVPRWSKENKCYSCHNNGDAARALYTAVRLGLTVPDKALADTTAWLARPEKGDKNGGEGEFSDRQLARLQFACALVEAMDAGRVKDPKPLLAAARLVAEYQHKDGSWQVIASGGIGSPVTYGPLLATFQARRVLHKADPKRYREAITRADRWLR